MQVGPVVAIDQRVPDALVVLALDLYGHGEPLCPLGRLDEVPVSPVPSGVLHVVIQDELIDMGDEVEVAFPRNVIGLQDGNALHGCSVCLGR